MPPLRPSLLALAALLLAAPGSADSGAGGFWRSLVLPGWGQHAAGEGRAARRFLSMEAMLWLGYWGLQGVAGIREENYRTYAAAHAGARTGEKGEEYFDDLGFYDSHNQHNRFAKVEDGAQAELYPGTPEFSWEWDAETSRLRYRQLRNGAEGMKRNALYLTGLVVVNHLASAVHAARAMRLRAGEPSQAALSLDWRLSPRGAVIGLRRRF